jgi:hypothetical protein
MIGRQLRRSLVCTFCRQEMIGLLCSYVKI